MYMGIEEKILAFIKKHKAVSGSAVARYLEISRQAANKHLKKMIGMGKVVRDGVTRGATYRIATKGKSRETLILWRKKYSLKNLEEHVVFSELRDRLNLGARLRDNVLDIVNYAFTEILNNAIEHSKSETCVVEVRIKPYDFEFVVRDFGIGIFDSIRSKFNLRDEYVAAGELIKGKTTTMAERHSGEGIFFTSKCGDMVTFRSHRINLIFDNNRRDIFIEDKRLFRGTEVSFAIKRNSRRLMSEIFKEYAPEEYEYRFEKTRVNVKLFGKGHVSRSSARRLLVGLEKFSVIVLDFKDVRSMGQSFADEVFRVFPAGHPKIRIEAVNCSQSLLSMINHVVDKKMNERLTIG